MLRGGELRGASRENWWCLLKFRPLEKGGRAGWLLEQDAEVIVIMLEICYFSLFEGGKVWGCSE